ncbi:hypothetical protein V496_01063 [Pseudogymnoascus sp. VKM F-4515 (FW-2607)]|nr:hypothetical protein V496_01063 [Pseudogymnoascus sp. VKM F-4515 (FW-2607)]KFY95952.1 hypothetical protein V498_03030 [Pseudogymnoascus sp. VKM F-4517 (FW-2822)]
MSFHNNTGPYTAAWLVSWPIQGKDDLPLRWEDPSGTEYMNIGVAGHLRDSNKLADVVGLPLDALKGSALTAVVLICTRDTKVNMDLDWAIDIDLRHLWGGHAEVIASWDAIASGWRWEVVRGEACNLLGRREKFAGS